MINSKDIKSFGEFSTSKKEGVYVEFAEDGVLKHIGSYEDGILSGWSIDVKSDSATLKYQLEYIPTGDSIEEDNELDEWAMHKIKEIFDHANHVIRCAFCEKSDTEVLKMIAGPTSYICNECVVSCHEIVAETPGQKNLERYDAKGLTGMG